MGFIYTSGYTAARIRSYQNLINNESINSKFNKCMMNRKCNLYSHMFNISIMFGIYKDDRY